MVRSGLVMAWRLATSPTSTSPDLAKPTTDGVVLPPSALGMTTGSPPSSTLTTELVVPRSIPTALAIVCSSVPLFSARPRGTATDSVHLWHRSYLPMGVLERFAFYEAARGCYAVVLTGE